MNVIQAWHENILRTVLSVEWTTLGRETPGWELYGIWGDGDRATCDA